jgi:two-component system, chemotaxis family, protein-glutamate methylesterase/glutaminase
MRYRAVVIGGSSGGMDALLAILDHLPERFPVPLLVVHHLHKSDGGGFCEHLASRSRLPVSEALDKEAVEAGHIYIAPADYHLLVEREGTFALSVDPKVNWARPSIDVLFESAAWAFGDQLVGVILSGANDDGALGMKRIRDARGLCIAQDPATADSRIMPEAAIRLASIEVILPPAEIGLRLARLGTTDRIDRPTHERSEG